MADVRRGPEASLGAAPPTIRHATDGDAAEIASIQNALLATTTIEWTESPHTEADAVEWIRRHDVVLVAVDAGEVVGFAAYGPFRDNAKWPGYRRTVENTIHVRQDRWGTAVGRRLMERLIGEARAAGLHVMVAAVDGGNEGSVRFHERLGFTTVGHLPQVGEKFGRWLDLVLLQLRLDDRPAP